MAAGDLGVTCQATTPEGLSIQETPSSGAVKSVLCWKLIMPKTIAARVASASTAAPNRTRRLSLNRALNGYSHRQQVKRLASILASKLYRFCPIFNYLKINRIHANFGIGRHLEIPDLQLMEYLFLFLIDFKD